MLLVLFKDVISWSLGFWFGSSLFTSHRSPCSSVIEANNEAAPLDCRSCLLVSADERGVFTLHVDMVITSLFHIGPTSLDAGADRAGFSDFEKEN